MKVEKKNLVDVNHAMFQWGPTKNAVILKDMVEYYDKKVPGHPKLGSIIGRAFNHLSLALKIVELEWTHRKAPSIFENGVWITGDKGSPKTHIAWEQVEEEVDFLESVIEDRASEIISVFRAVCKELIGMRMTKLGVAPKSSKHTYTTWDLADWVKQENVIAARGAWKQKVSGYKPDGR